MMRIFGAWGRIAGTQPLASHAAIVAPVRICAVRTVSAVTGPSTVPGRPRQAPTGTGT